eukprot:TRINITY_DN10191_c0_g1_i1.p1 TRINITY_DN10191_c0_g1~~TRINITY_DN10191_c0_g1_i1.p1  ORF type:complete len:229 (+),score=42.19 TRINITY_DN10191_c0_g1_i1:50-736(+)
MLVFQVDDELVAWIDFCIENCCCKVYWTDEESAELKRIKSGVAGVVTIKLVQKVDRDVRPFCTLSKDRPKALKELRSAHTLHWMNENEEKKQQIDETELEKRRNRKLELQRRYEEIIYQQMVGDIGRNNQHDVARISQMMVTRQVIHMSNIGITSLAVGAAAYMISRNLFSDFNMMVAFSVSCVVVCMIVESLLMLTRTYQEDSSQARPKDQIPSQRGSGKISHNARR